MKVIVILSLICFSAVCIDATKSKSKSHTPPPAPVEEAGDAESAGGGGAGEEAGAATPVAAAGGGAGTFNVKDFGAKGDGKADDCKAFDAAWQAACKCTGNPKVVIPAGTYLAGPVQFHGPCKGATTITVQVEGTVKASTNLAQYGGRDWISFSWLTGLILTGSGTFDGQGAVTWPNNQCAAQKNCNVLPSNLKFNAMKGTKISGITSLNSKYFHFTLVDCQDFNVNGIHITAPEESPNTDGIHIERSTDVTITDSTIGTGDDCIGIGHSNTHITITGVKCGPGHGISVGSLGKYKHEKDVTGLLVKNCTFTSTQNGVRIKTWESSPVPSCASNLTFEDLTMNNVENPIIIDQTYCPFTSCAGKEPSKVKLEGITFRNIKGTSSTPVAVTLECSKNIPCKNVVLENINLVHSAGSKSACVNIEAKYVGTHVPPPCKV